MSEDVASLLAGTNPELARAWATSAPDLDLPYVALGHLASKVEALDAERPDIDLAPLFAAFERRLHAASQHWRDLLVYGFLESLQNVTLRSGRDLSHWAPYLGPETKAAWSGLIALWSDGGGTDIERWFSDQGFTTDLTEADGEVWVALRRGGAVVALRYGRGHDRLGALRRAMARYLTEQLPMSQ